MLPKRCGGIFAGLVMLCRVSISCYTVLAIGAGEQFSRVCLAHTAPGFCVAVKLSPHHQAWCRGQCVARLNLASQDPDGLRHWDALQPKGINCCYRGLNHDLYWRVPYNNLRKRDRKTLL